MKKAIAVIQPNIDYIEIDPKTVVNEKLIVVFIFFWQLSVKA